MAITTDLASLNNPYKSQYQDLYGENTRRDLAKEEYLSQMQKQMIEMHRNLLNNNQGIYNPKSVPDAPKCNIKLLLLEN